MPATTNENDACVRCKAQKQGGDKCRASHTESEYPSTSLSQTHCIALLKFRGTTYPHGDLLKDQRLLEKALREEGRGGMPPQDEDVVIVDDQSDSELPADFEWGLREWGLQNGRYKTKAMFLGRSSTRASNPRA